MRSRSPLRSRHARWSLRCLASATLSATICLVAVVPAATASPLREFVDRTLADGQDARDSLAAYFNPVQLPLIAAALAADREGHAVDPDRLYRAFARWHFWTGTRWTATERGLWGVDVATVPVGAIARGQVLAAHATLELVQLAALARMAAANDNVYDALVWWSDHAQLRTRLVQRLHDPLRGGYADLDSAGTPLARQEPDQLVPLAVGAPAITELARRSAWQLWGGTEPLTKANAAAQVQAIERADALNGWSGSPGSRLLEPATMATLIHAGVRTLADPALDMLVRDAMGSVGLAPTDSLTLRMGAWTPRLAVRDLAPESLDRARTGIVFLDRAGVLVIGEADSLLHLLDTAADEAQTEHAIGQLTAALGRWRAIDMRAHRYVWQNRRETRPAANGKNAVFRLQDGDLAMWVGRALDCITEDIIAFHLRPRENAAWRATVEPAVAGRGDAIELILFGGGLTGLGADERITAQAIFTDGLRILSPRTIELVVDAEGGARGALGLTPDTTGAWRLILEGLPAAVRVPASVAVVEPLQLHVAPLSRRGRSATLRVEVASQVRQPTSGRIEAQPPLSFSAAPATRLEFALDGGATQGWELTFHPASDDSPALYPVRWMLFDRAQQLGTVETVVSVPFEWLRLGPLPARGAVPIDESHPPDVRVQLAQRLPGARGEVGWNRMPTSRESADGWVQLAHPDDPAGVHYAFTAFTTGSREARVRLEADGPVILRVNGRVAVRTPDWGGQARGEFTFGAGTNYVLVKVFGGGGRPGSFRLDLRDVDGQPLRGVTNSLDMLLDEMAYLTRTTEVDQKEKDVGRESLRLMPLTYTNPTAQSVSVVGSFNGWSPTATRMVRLEDGRWQAKVRLRPGRFEYKFAVDGDQWIADPVNPEAVSDGFGGRNSVLVVD